MVLSSGVISRLPGAGSSGALPKTMACKSASQWCSTAARLSCKSQSGLLIQICLAFAQE